MRVARLAVVGFVALSQVVSAQLTLSWVTNYNGAATSNDVPVAFKLDGANNIYVAGYSHNGTNYDIVALKYSPSGNLLWAQKYAAGGDDFAGAAELDAAGNFYVAAEINSPTNFASSATVLKFSSAGALVYATRLNTASNSSTRVAGTGLDAAGNLFVAGDSDGFGTGAQVYVAKVNGSGSNEWVVPFAGLGGYQVARGVAVDPAGSSYVMGRIFDPAVQSERVAFLKYNNSGVLQWVRYSDPQSYDGGTANPVLLSQDAGIYFVGYAQRSGALWKFDSSGTLVWERQFGGAAAQSAVVDMFGNVTLSASETETLRVTHIDRLGDQRWSATVLGARPYGSGSSALALDSQFNPYLSSAFGTSSWTSTHFLVTKYESNGSRSWTRLRPIVDSDRNRVVQIAITNGGLYTVNQVDTSRRDIDIQTARYILGGTDPGPRIVGLSPSLTVTSGTAVTLSVSVAGTGPFSYQWYQDGVPVSMATDAMLSLPAVMPFQTGSYWVRVRNVSGEAVSAHVVVSVFVPPTDQQTIVGGNALFTASITGAPPRSVQWRFNGTNIPNATGTSLQLSNVTLAMAGVYTAVIESPFAGSLAFSASLFVTDQVRVAWRTNLPDAIELWGLVNDNHGGIAVATDSELTLLRADGSVSNREFAGGYAGKMAADAAGNIYLYTAGTVGGPSTERARKYSAGLRGIEWNRVGRTSWSIEPVGIVVDDDGSIFGFENERWWRTAPDSDYYLSRFSETNAVIIGAGAVRDAIAEFGKQVQFAPGNDLYLLANLGHYFHFGESSNFIQRLTRAGVTLWSRVFQESEIGLLSFLLADDEGSLFMVGNVSGAASGEPGAYSILKLDENGSLLWSRRFYSSTNTSAQPQAAALDRGSNIVVTGSSGTVKLNREGVVQWVSSSVGSYLSVASNGDIYLGATISNGNGPTDIQILKLTAEGVTRWRAVYDSYGGGADVTWGLLADNGGVVVVGASGEPSFSREVLVSRYTDAPANSIAIQPLPVLVDADAGSSVQLTANVQGSGPFTYRWFFNGNALAQNSPSLLVPSFGPADVGGYSVEARNAAGAVLSTEAWLTRRTRLTVSTNAVTFSADPLLIYDVQRSVDLEVWLNAERSQIFSIATVSVPLMQTNTPLQMLRVRKQR